MVVNEVFTNSAEYGIISQQDFFDKDIANSNKVDGYYLVEPDDFVYNPRISNSAPFGPIKRNKLGRSGAMSPLYYVFRSHDVDKSYLDWFFQTNRWHAFMRFHGNTGVRSDRFAITDKIFAEMTISIPQDIDEQKAIGTFFTALDDSITLHQRKLESMKLLKKSLLQKMFPKSGETVPEVRFPGFTDAWEQRKLGDIVERITRKNTNNESDLPLTISAQYGLIDQNEFFDKRIASKDVSGYYLVKNGEFAYNKSTSNDAPWGAVKRLDRYKNGVVSTLYIVFSIRDSNTTDSDFLATYYDTDRWHSGIQAVAAEGARNHGLLNISASDFFNTTLKMPADIEEQRKIGAFFKEIDNTITLHQRAPNDAQSRLPIQTGGAIFTKQGYCLLSSGFNSLRISSLNSLLI